MSYGVQVLTVSQVPSDPDSSSGNRNRKEC